MSFPAPRGSRRGDADESARAADMYDTFKHKRDGCIKVVLKP